MGTRKKWKLKTWQLVLVIIGLYWFADSGRYYVPKWVRPPKGRTPFEVAMKTTSYCHCESCCSYDHFTFVPYQQRNKLNFRLKHIGLTSSGTMARMGTIAADTQKYPYGTVMYIPGYGYGRVEDVGGAIKGNHIDLYRPNHWFARQWGVRELNVKVWLPKNSS